MKKLFVLALAAALFGCISDARMAQIRAEEAKKVADEAALIQKSIDTIPTCNTKESCDSLMDIAQVWVSNNSSMKIQSATNAVITTYNDVNGWNATFTVRKEPVSIDTFKITLTTNASKLNDAKLRLQFNEELNKFIKK